MKGLCLGKKMWLSAALLLTMVLTLDSSWSLYIGPLWPTKYWKNTTACLQHKPQTGCHKTDETTSQVLNNGEFHEQWKLCSSIQKEKKHHSHSSICWFVCQVMRSLKMLQMKFCEVFGKIVHWDRTQSIVFIVLCCGISSTDSTRARVWCFRGLVGPRCPHVWNDGWSTSVRSR